MNKELKRAAKVGNKSKVVRLKETLGIFEAEESNYAEKRDCHERELNILQERCKQIDQKINASGITQLPSIKERGQLQPIAYC